MWLCAWLRRRLTSPVHALGWPYRHPCNMLQSAFLKQSIIKQSGRVQIPLRRNDPFAGKTCERAGDRMRTLACRKRSTVECTDHLSVTARTICMRHTFSYALLYAFGTRVIIDMTSYDAAQGIWNSWWEQQISIETPNSKFTAHM